MICILRYSNSFIKKLTLLIIIRDFLFNWIFKKLIKQEKASHDNKCFLIILIVIRLDIKPSLKYLKKDLLPVKKF